MGRKKTKPDADTQPASKTSVTDASASDAPRLIRLRELQRLIPLSRTSIWRGVADGTLPRPLRWGRSVFWRLDEVNAFIEAQTRRRNERQILSRV